MQYVIKIQLKAGMEEDLELGTILTMKPQEQVGGATDFRLVPGAWDDTDSLYSRIMVAGARRRCFVD